MALFLVDPNIKIISTTNIPPQRKDWWEQELWNQGALDRLPLELANEVVSEMEFPIDLAQAKKIREELMEERKGFAWSMRRVSTRTPSHFVNTEYGGGRRYVDIYCQRNLARHEFLTVMLKQEFTNKLCKRLKSLLRANNYIAFVFAHLNLSHPVLLLSSTRDVSPQLRRGSRCYMRPVTEIRRLFSPAACR